MPSLERRETALANYGSLALLPDFRSRGAVARRYGVYRARQGVSARALFVVEPLGVIRFSEVYPDALNSGVDEPLTALELLASGGAGNDAGGRAR